MTLIEFSIELSVDNADVLGEFLLAQFFVPPRADFKLRNDLKEKTVTTHHQYPHGPVYFNVEDHYASQTIDGHEVEAHWYYEEDWHLCFEFKDGSTLENHDAKKDHGWEFCSYEKKQRDD